MLQVEKIFRYKYTRESNEEKNVVISVNFTGGGRLFGLFEIRNSIKAALLMFTLPFGF